MAREGGMAEGSLRAGAPTSCSLGASGPAVVPASGEHKCLGTALCPVGREAVRFWRVKRDTREQVVRA